MSPFQRRALKAARRLDIPDADCKGEKDSGYVGRSAADGHQCCPFIPGGDLGMSRLEGSFSQLTRRKSLRRIGYRPALSRLGAWPLPAGCRRGTSRRANQSQLQLDASDPSGGARQARRDRQGKGHRSACPAVAARLPLRSAFCWCGLRAGTGDVADRGVGCDGAAGCTSFAALH